MSTPKLAIVVSTYLVLIAARISSRRMPFKTHHCAIELGIGFFLKMFRLAAGKNIPATSIYFTFDIDASKQAYEEYFQCPVYGSQAVNGISFSMENGDTSARVIKIINERFPLGCPTEETLAYKLPMSKRTLQRKLSQEKQSFLTLITSVRLLLAKQK